MDQVLSACVSGDVASLETALWSLPTAVKGAEALATPLHDAARQGHAPCVQLLLQAGASPDSPLGLGAMRPLHEAALYGNVECIKVLCLAGADPNSTNADCKTPLALAFDVLKKRKQDLSAVARTLVAYGATSDHNAVLNLTSLDISNLGLQTIPASLLRLPNLQHLQGVNDGNPLTTIPFNVKRAGRWIPEIKTYLQEIADSGRFLWSKAKVMVLGKEGSGKTHLLRCLQKASYERNESTNGIDINMFKLEEKELTWFDFGGQEIFYPTHQFFLTAYCVYLIVFRLNDSDYFERVQHWLQVVSQFAQDPRRPAKIVLVGTHLDAVSAKEAAAVWEALKTVLDEEGSAHITAMVSVSCKARTGLKELQAAILKAIELGGFGSHLVPGMYLQVWAELERLRAGNIRKLPSSQFFRHWKSEVSTCIFGALQFFMDAGQCFVDQDLDLLVTDLQWLADLFKQVISFYSGVANGVVKLSGLKHAAWKDLPTSQVRHYMALLEKFEMAFPRLEDETWVVPSMLKEKPVMTEPPGAAGKSIRKSERIHEFTSMPLGLVGRLMVRLQGNSETTVLEMWRHGMHLATRDGSQLGSIVLELTKTKRFSKARLRVSCFQVGPSSSPSRLMHLIAQECRSVLSDASMHVHAQDAFSELVACPHCVNNSNQGNITYLSMEECVQLVVNREPFFVCAGSDKVSVHELSRELVLGGLDVVDDGALDMGADPFAAGGFGILYRAKFRKDNTAVVVKEVSRTKAKLWRELRSSSADSSSSSRSTSLSALPSTGSTRLSPSVESSELEPFDNAAFESFQHEASMMQRLRNECIVKFYGIMFRPLRIVMELCPEGDLALALANQIIWGGPVPLHDATAVIPPLCLKVIENIAQGMAFMHSCNPPVAHRDLRSPNVFLMSLNPADNVCAKVADFGLSVAITSHQTAALTCWPWMAPEAQMGAHYTQACDLYSFAIVVVEILTQKLPFSEYITDSARHKAHRVIGRICKESLRPSIPGFVPPELRSLINSMWRAEPEKRTSFAGFLKGRDDNEPGVGNRLVRNSRLPPASVRTVFENVEGLCGHALSHSASEVWVGSDRGEMRVFSLATLKVMRADKLGDAKLVALCARYAVNSEGRLYFCESNGKWISDKATRKNLSGRPPLASPRKGITGLFSRKVSSSEVSRPTSGSQSPSPAASPRKGKSSTVEVAFLVLSADLVFFGTAEGEVSVYSLDKQQRIASTTLPGPISCMCGVAGSRVWVAVGGSLYELVYRLQVLSAQVVVSDAHSDTETVAMVYTPQGHVWSATHVGEVCVWDAATGVRKTFVDIHSQLHCMCSVEVRGINTVWMGGDEDIRIFDSTTYHLLSTVSAPVPGIARCIEQVALDVVWVAIHHRQSPAALPCLSSLYQWDFSQ